MSASVTTLLMTNKNPKDGAYPIYIRITIHRKTKYLSIGARCKPELWDNSKGLPRSKHPLFHHLNLLISEKTKQAQKEIIEAEVNGLTIGAGDIKETLKPKAPKTANMIALIDQLEAEFNADNRIGNAKIYKSLRNSLVTFNGSECLYFDQINLDFLQRYEKSFTERGVKLNSAFVFMRTLKTAVNTARKRGLIEKDFDPYENYSFLKFRKIKTKKRKISKEEILMIANLDTKEHTWQRHAQNIFMFSYYNFGINFVDIAYLKWDNINKQRLSYTRKKTGDVFDIKLNEPSKAILDYYKNNPHPDANNYIFPILSSVHKTDKSIDNRVRKVIQIVNKSLRIIAAECGIDEHLTTYVARHSFANVLKQNKVPTSVISEMMGHETERITQVYLDSFGDETIDEAAKKLI